MQCDWVSSTIRSNPCHIREIFSPLRVALYPYSWVRLQSLCIVIRYHQPSAQGHVTSGSVMGCHSSHPPQSERRYKGGGHFSSSPTTSPSFSRKKPSKVHPSLFRYHLLKAEKMHSTTLIKVLPLLAAFAAAVPLAVPSEMPQLWST